MMKRLLVIGLGTTVVQVILFYLFILIVYWFAAALTAPSGVDANGAFVVLLTAMSFPIIVLIQNLIAAVVNNIKATYVLMAITIALYVVGLIDIGSSVAFQAWLCLIFGLVVLGIKTKIDERLR